MKHVIKFGKQNLSKEKEKENEIVRERIQLRVLIEEKLDEIEIPA